MDESNGAQELRFSVGLTRKINMGNYESAEASVYVSNVLPDTSEEEIRGAITAGKLAWSVLGEALTEKIAQVRKGQL